MELGAVTGSNGWSCCKSSVHGPRPQPADAWGRLLSFRQKGWALELEAEPKSEPGGVVVAVSRVSCGWVGWTARVSPTRSAFGQGSRQATGVGPTKSPLVWVRCSVGTHHAIVASGTACSTSLEDFLVNTRPTAGL